MFTGLLLGLMFTVNFLISITGISFASLINLIVAIFIVYYLYRSAVKFRDIDCDGAITYGKSLSYVILSFFFAALISAIVKYIYVALINRDYLDMLLQESYKALDILKFPVTEEAYTQLEKMMTPVGFAFQSIWTNVLFGLVLGLIISIFIKKEKSIFE